MKLANNIQAFIPDSLLPALDFNIVDNQSVIDEEYEQFCNVVQRKMD